MLEVWVWLKIIESLFVMDADDAGPVVTPNHGR
jgi:hypothetical protein